MALRSRSRVVLFALVTVAAVSAALIACSTFGEGNDAPDAGMQPEAAAPPTDGAVVPTRGRCKDRTDLLLCEDFEGTLPLSKWVETPDGGTVAVKANPDGPGSVLQAQIRSGISEPHAFIYRNVADWGNAVYVRLFVYLDKALADDDAFPFLVLAPVELDLLGNKLRLNQFELPRVDLAAPEPFPTASWACVEWHLTPTESTVWLNDKVVISAPATTFGTAFSRITLGLNYNGKTSAQATLHLDDIVVSKARVRCD